MALQKFIDDFEIDLEALNRIKKRVFIVGRFNQRAKDADPEIFLFTKRSDLSPKYVANFTGVDDMNYESFVKALRPAIAERIGKKEDYRFATVEQVVPQGDEALDGSSIIDTFNYFFRRAVANSDQDHFRGEQDTHQDVRQEMPTEMLQDDDRDRGKAILGQIRKNLKIFCSFQPDTHQIIECFARLMGECGRQHNLPYFAYGGPLPGGSPERLLDFIYAEDHRSYFDTGGLAFTGVWSKLRDDKKGRETFCNVAEAFRDTLLSVPEQQHSNKRFAGNRPLSKLAESVISDDLKSSFQKSRAAFNGLRQILRSKVLLSMVLEWLLSTYYKINDVDDKMNDYQRDKAVENAIFERWKENGLAKPVKRPSRRERARFSELLTKRFEDVLDAILASDEKYPELASDLPKQLLEMVESVRGDAEKRRLLASVAGTDLNAELHKAFMDAAKTVLLDVLCPGLYRNPVVSTQMLKKLFRQETMAAYLTAVFLGDSSQDAVRKIADEHLEFFESKIDESTQMIGDENEILQRLLVDFLDVLTAPEIQRRLSEGVRVLQEIHALLENTELEKERRGGAGISSARTSKDVEGTLKETPVDRDIIKIAARQRVEAKLEERLDSIVTAAGSAATADTAKKTKKKVDKQGNTDKNAEKKLDEESVPDSRLDRKIDEIMGKTLQNFEITDDRGPSAGERQDLAKQISEEVLEDEDFVGGLAEDLAAFESTLHLIYSRYVDNPDKQTFRNKVERMTLTNMMLLFQNELGLGRVNSNLYHLLLDLVLYLDPTDPDPKDFMRSRSLTHYFDGADLQDGGVTALRQTLDVQSKGSLDNIVRFVSELRGVKYLMDVVNDWDAEVIVVNATASKFIDWLKADNLTEGQGKGLLRSGSLVRTGDASQSTIPPGLVYLTDIAFPEGGPGGWITGLEAESLSREGLSYVLPPICLSTPPQDKDSLWASEGESLAAAAEKAPSPIVVVGPSPQLNPAKDGFPTILPAGYLFAAHFLMRPEQKVHIKNIARKSKGRFRIIGYGAAPMRENLDRILWGESDDDNFAFAADFYLYIILTVLATMRRYGGMQSINVKEFFQCFYFESPEMIADGEFKSSEILSSALIGQNALALGMDQNPADSDLESVTYAPSCKILLDSTITRRKASTLQWFNIAQQKAGLV